MPLVEVSLQTVEEYWLRGVYVFEDNAGVRELVELYGQPITMVNLHNLGNYLEDVRYHLRRAAEAAAPNDWDRRLMR